MFSVLIVDDECLERRGLCRHFDWQAHGMEVAGEAENGAEALRFLEDRPVDFLVTDVAMPVMDGIELAREAKKRYPSMKILFISGYNDLEYLKGALTVEAVDYLLKAIDLEEMSQTVRRVAAELSRERQKEDLLRNMESQLQQSIPLLQEKLLRTLIRDEDLDEMDVDGQIAFLGLPLSARDRYCLFVMRVANYYACFTRRSERERQLLSLAVQRIAREALSAHFTPLVCESGQGECVCVLRLPEAQDLEETLLSLSESLCETYRNTFDMEMHIGISHYVEGYAHLCGAYRGAVSALNRNLLGGNRQVAVDMEERPALSPFRALEKQLLAAVQAGQSSFSDTLYLELKAIENVDELRNTLFYLMISLSRISHQYQLHSEQANYGILSRKCEAFFCCRTPDEMIRLVLAYYQELLEEMRQRPERRRNHLVSHIQQVIARRYRENLTVAELAKEVYLTPTYLCQLFKQETDVTVNEYMTALRLEKAKELLRDPSIKLYDVCAMIGYASPAYFTKLFKRHTGLTPSEYRDTAPSREGAR